MRILRISFCNSSCKSLETRTTLPRRLGRFSSFLQASVAGPLCRPIAHSRLYFRRLASVTSIACVCVFCFVFCYTFLRFMRQVLFFFSYFFRGSSSHKFERTSLTICPNDLSSSPLPSKLTEFLDSRGGHGTHNRGNTMYYSLLHFIVRDAQPIVYIPVA